MKIKPPLTVTVRERKLDVLWGEIKWAVNLDGREARIVEYRLLKVNVSRHGIRFSLGRRMDCRWKGELVKLLFEGRICPMNT